MEFPALHLEAEICAHVVCHILNIVPVAFPLDPGDKNNKCPICTSEYDAEDEHLPIETSCGHRVGQDCFATKAETSLEVVGKVFCTCCKVMLYEDRDRIVNQDRFDTLGEQPASPDMWLYGEAVPDWATEADIRPYELELYLIIRRPDFLCAENYWQWQFTNERYREHLQNTISSSTGDQPVHTEIQEALDTYMSNLHVWLQSALDDFHEAHTAYSERVNNVQGSEDNARLMEHWSLVDLIESMP